MLVASDAGDHRSPVTNDLRVEEVPCISTVAPWQPWFIGQQGNPGDPASVGAVPLRLPLLLGPGGHHLGVHRDVGPGRDQQVRRRPLPQRRRPATPGAIRWWASRRCWPTKGYRLTDSRPLPEPDRRFHRADQRLQAGQRRDRDGRGHPRRTSPPSGPRPAQQGLSTRRWPRSARRSCSLQAVETLGDAGHNLSSEDLVVARPTPSRPRLTRPERRAKWPPPILRRPGRQWTQPIGLSCTPSSSSPSTSCARAGAPDDRDAVGGSDRGDAVSTRSSGASERWTGAGLPPFAQANVAKTPLVGWAMAPARGRRLPTSVVTENGGPPDHSPTGPARWRRSRGLRSPLPCRGRWIAAKAAKTDGARRKPRSAKRKPPTVPHPPDPLRGSFPLPYREEKGEETPAEGYTKPMPILELSPRVSKAFGSAPPRDGTEALSPSRSSRRRGARRSSGRTEAGKVDPVQH